MLLLGRQAMIGQDPLQLALHHRLNVTMLSTLSPPAVALLARMMTYLVAVTATDVPSPGPGGPGLPPSA
jgi:hypothetical protein